MKKFDLKKLVFAGGINLPSYQSSWDLEAVVKWCILLISNLIPILISAAVLVLLYGIAKYIAKAGAGDTKDRADSIKFMIYGIVGITVMVSVWGLVSFITTTFGVPSLGVPQFPTSGPSN